MTNPESESVPRVRLGVHLSGTLGIPGAWRRGYKPAERGWGGGQEGKEIAEKSTLKHRKEKTLFCRALPAPGEQQKMKGQSLPRESWGCSLWTTHTLGWGFLPCCPDRPLWVTGLSAPRPVPAGFKWPRFLLLHFRSEKELGFLGFLSRWSNFKVRFPRGRANLHEGCLENILFLYSVPFRGSLLFYLKLCLVH